MALQSHLSAVDTLISRGRAPLGASMTVHFDTASGPLAELATVLSRHNGFTVFNNGVQVFRAGTAGLGPEVQSWNDPGAWKSTYGGLADGLLCFAQDLFGVQFAIDEENRVVRFDPETADRRIIGVSVNSWAQWLLADPDVNGTYGFATAWQDRFGALQHNQRILPRTLFALGGSYDFDNLSVEDSLRCMRIRGPIAQRVHDTPDDGLVNLISSRAEPEEEI